jgi:hypothetical protein
MVQLAVSRFAKLPDAASALVMARSLDFASLMKGSGSAATLPFTATITDSLLCVCSICEGWGGSPDAKK